MFRHPLLTALLSCVFLTGTLTSAQNLCPVGAPSPKLVCLIPQVYGANVFAVKNPFPAEQQGFQTNFLSNSLSSLQSSIARQSALLPLASPTSGVTFVWDTAAQVFTASTDSFGPILGERADTIGRHRFFLGFSYQYFNFNKIDGQDLRNLPVVLPQADDTSKVDSTGNPRTCSINGDDKGDCGPIRDVITTDNRLDLKIHQFTTFITFGLTNRIDVSLAIPIANVRMGLASTATVSHNDAPNRFAHAFPARPDCPLPVVNPDLPDEKSCLVSSFSNVNNASGIGDITFRAKGTAWKGERAAVSAGMDIRFPSGDELNFLGSGTIGFKPFVVWSYRARISPHAFVGYEVNGSSQIADISAGKKTKLPSQLIYSGGADIWLTKRFTAAFDIVGQQVLQAPRTSRSIFTEPGACKDTAPTATCGCTDPADPTTCAVSDSDPNFFDTPKVDDPNLVSSVGSFNISNLSVGVKIKPVSTLMVTANVLIRLNDAGLHSKAVPLVGISYTF